MIFRILRKSIDIIDLLCYTISNNSCIILTLENVRWVKNQYSGGLPVKMVCAFHVSSCLFVVLVLKGSALAAKTQRISASIPYHTQLNISFRKERRHLARTVFFAFKASPTLRLQLNEPLDSIS